MSLLKMSFKKFNEWFNQLAEVDLSSFAIEEIVDLLSSKKPTPDTSSEDSSLKKFLNADPKESLARKGFLAYYILFSDALRELFEISTVLSQFPETYETQDEEGKAIIKAALVSIGIKKIISEKRTNCVIEIENEQEAVNLIENSFSALVVECLRKFNLEDKGAIAYCKAAILAIESDKLHSDIAVAFENNFITAFLEKLALSNSADHNAGLQWACFHAIVEANFDRRVSYTTPFLKETFLEPLLDLLKTDPHLHIEKKQLEELSHERQQAIKMLQMTKRSTKAETRFENQVNAISGSGFFAAWKSSNPETSKMTEAMKQLAEKPMCNIL